ncbi:MAG: hypothetical protein EOP04_01400 [Proteobacteria bacterium]|nr:MAG: hypothetical protein EOP04_01400 [Pseudomonadota bacterium]
MTGQNQEKSLLEIFCKTIPQLPKNKFNSFVGWSGVLLLFIPAICGPSPDFLKTIAGFTDLLSQIYAGILGFIIAGYAIFTSSSNPHFLVEIWRYEEPKSKMPLLKVHLLVYVRLFVAIFLSLIGVLAISLTSRLWPMLSPHVQISDDLARAIQSLIAAILGLSMTQVCIHTKVLIFNLYDLTITQVKYIDLTSDDP